jgi:hypothetical protein
MIRRRPRTTAVGSAGRLPHPCRVKFPANILCETHRGRAKWDRPFPELAAVKTQQPIASDDEHRVLKFRPRTLAHPPGRPDNQVREQPQFLSRLERDRQEPDEFRHRMLANVAALAFTIALTAIGIWLAISIADLRKTQDCVLMGRHDCAQISGTAQLGPVR